MYLLYLSHDVKSLESQTEPVIYRKVLLPTLDWMIYRDKDKVNIDPKHEDDIFLKICRK